MGFFGYRPREDLISRMEQRAKEVLLLPLTETFDGKSLCKLLRAYTNMGRQPAEELWGLLEQRMGEKEQREEAEGVIAQLKEELIQVHQGHQGEVSAPLRCMPRMVRLGGLNMGLSGGGCPLCGDGG